MILVVEANTMPNVEGLLPPRHRQGRLHRCLSAQLPFDNKHCRIKQYFKLERALRNLMHTNRNSDHLGRVHLALVRDRATGDEQVMLDRPIFQEDWQNELAAGTASTSRAVLGDRPTGEVAASLGSTVMGAVSRLTEGLLARAPQGSVACRAGCDHCCYQAVSVTLPEALAIMSHLRATLGKEELAQLARRLAAASENTRGLTADERFSPSYPCPFLVVAEGRCAIYQARPMTCRGMNSLDAGECERRLHDENARAAFLAGGQGSRSFLEPIRAVHAVSAGLQVALSELYGLDMRPLDLTAIMHLLLGATGQPAESFTQLEAWLGGRSPFESAVRAPARRDAGSEALSGKLAPEGNAEG